MTYALLARGALAACCTLALTAAWSGARAEAPRCELDRPVVFAGLDYDSAAFHNALARAIIEAGYGCATDAIPTTVIPGINGMAKGDIDVDMEIWINNAPQVWHDALARGDVVSLGTNFPDAVEAWWVPRYVVEGPDAPAPDLKSVADLARHKNLFEDPEEPGKGRFYSCPPGWNCEVLNSKKLAAYGLLDDFTNFRPGTGIALSAAIEGHYKRKKPIVFYYWGPTWVLGKLDVVALEEPAHDPEIWAALKAEENPQRACASPLAEVIIAANAEFARQAPVLAGFLSAYETDSKMVSQALAHMRDHDATAEDAARHFLRDREDVWTAWVPSDVADRVRASLD